MTGARRSDPGTSTPASCLAYWVTSPGVGALREEQLGDARLHESLVRAEYSAVSVGTERVVGLGLVPKSAADAMACAHMAGSFDLPVKYGYSLVGEVVAGRDVGQRVHVMHPHQDWAVVDARRVVVLPPSVPSARATLLPNVETALNAYLDAEVGDGSERALIVGAGVVGLLVAFVLQAHGYRATLVDIDAGRRRFPENCGLAVDVVSQVEAGSFDVAFHTSATSAGLQTAIDALGFEGRVVELSWYGDRQVSIALGASFHYERKRILATQVAHVAKPVRARMSHAQRMERVLALLADGALDGVLAPAIDFSDLPALMQRVYDGSIEAGLPLVRYPRASDAAARERRQDGA
ncbi:MAG TPA: zinc-binding alcohol dehydrogenase [Planctomycetota bacterium]|nr:zinc-binding alcohol dehydrogenase [Planctomycetota bacterium]